jgi:predicted nucleotidyltransferase
MMSVATAVTSTTVPSQTSQLDLLRSVSRILETSPVVSHLLIRGSLASGTADRSSDVDLVIGVTAPALRAFLSSLDILMRTELGALFPGWADSLVRDMGGQGYVYLVPTHDTLCELDLYVVAEHGIAEILQHGAVSIFSRTALSQPNAVIWNLDRPQTPKPISTTDSIARDLVVEVLVLFHMMSKRVTRKQSFIVYGHTYLLNNAVRRLIKHCLAPRSKHWGWYHLEEDLADDPRGRACLGELAELVDTPLICNRESLDSVFARVERVIRCAAPEVWTELGRELDAYRRYMGLC